MKNRKQIEQDVEKTLNSLDGMQKATSNPFLYTRVRARLVRKDRSSWSAAFHFLGRPTVAFSMVVLAVAVNALLYFEFKSEPTQSSGEGAQVFATEYNLTDNTIYDSTVEPE